MSIINEALKKAGQGQTTAAGSGKPQGSEASRLSAPILQQPARRKQSINWGPVFVVLVLTMITGPLVAPIFSSPYRSTQAPTLVPSYREALSDQQVAANRQAQFAIEEAPRVAAPAGLMLKPDLAFSPEIRGNFVMNGIVYSSPNSFCIINGKVVKVGEKVNGATLMSVTPEKATLNYEGRTIDLWVA